MPERREIKVLPDKVQSAVKQGSSKGYRLVSQRKKGKEVVLLFEREDAPAETAAPKHTVPDINLPTAQKAPFYRRPFWWFLITLVFACCGGLCMVSLLISTADEETDTAEIQTNIERVAQQPTDSPSPTITISTTLEPTAVPEISSAVSITAGDFQVAIQRIWEVTEASNRKPDRVSFLIMEITLYNNSDEEFCFKQDHFKADARGRDIQPSFMREVRDEFYPDWDFPGAFNGQCVDENASERSLLVYDIPENLTTITIEFTPDDKAKFKIWLSRQSSNEYLFGLDSFSEGVAMQATFTPTATASNTPLPTHTFTPSPTPYYEPIPDPQGRVPENYQAMMSEMDNRIRAIDGVENVSQHTIMFHADHPDGYLAGFRIQAEDGKNLNERFAIAIRQAIRNVLFEFYGSYPYIGIALTIDDGDEWLWTWGSNDEIWVVQDVKSGATLMKIKPTNTSRPRPIDEPAEPDVDFASGTRYVATGGATLNVRSCPSSDCRRIGSLNFAAAVTLTGKQGNWYRIEFNGGEGWIMAQYTSATRPSVSSSGSDSNSNSGAVPPVTEGSGCNGASNCSEMTSCEQAYACLNAGNSGLDRDNDGVPCESICPGG